jgi:hypothetical protein
MLNDITTDGNVEYEGMKKATWDALELRGESTGDYCSILTLYHASL